MRVGRAVEPPQLQKRSRKSFPQLKSMITRLLLFRQQYAQQIQDNIMSQIYHALLEIPGYLLLTIVVLHLLFTFVFKNKPIKLGKDSLVVVTGGCMGIGLQMTLELAKKYHSRFLIVDRRKDLFEQTKALVAQAGGECECKEADLGNDESVNQLIEFLLNRKQAINLFIYNAGIVIPKKTWQTTEQEHMIVMKVNYFTPTLMIKKLQALLVGNHIAVTASIAAMISGGVNCSVYSASKHAIFGYLSSLRQQYKKDKKNITVSIGCPYVINTTMFTGFRTRLDFLFRHLDEKYVGQRLAKQFVQRKQVSYIYQYEAVLFRIIQALPTAFIDYFALKMDTSDFEELRKRQEEEKAKAARTAKTD